MKFSERMGIQKPKIDFQKESMDSELSNGIWSYLTIDIFENFPGFYSSFREKEYKLMRHLIERLWLDFFKNPIDTAPEDKERFLKRLRDWYFNAASWYQKYEFIEFIVENHQDNKEVEKLIDNLNSLLKRELSAYRIVSQKITPITSEIDIAEIEKAIENPNAEVSKHLIRALELLSDKKNPDYRNSIKESISAVETMCKTISQDTKSTLGDALEKLRREGKINLHQALSSAFNNLYGYTNDAEGIRHSLMEEETLDQEDAQFMLVSCSAFVNYLIVKTLKSQD
jgi:hypothetical protein